MKWSWRESRTIWARKIIMIFAPRTVTFVPEQWDIFSVFERGIE